MNDGEVAIVASAFTRFSRMSMHRAAVRPDSLNADAPAKLVPVA
jgi:hypothetical protein